MRILLVAPEFPPQLGGMETYAYELAHALSASHDVCVLCRQGSEKVPGTETLPAFTGDDPCIEVLEAVERFRPDVVHLLNAGLSPAIPKLGERNVPAIVTVHGKDYFQPWLASRSEVKAALPLAGGVIAVSQLVKSRLLMGGIEEGTIAVVGHGVDTALFVPWKKLTASGPTLITVARIIPKKNIEAVIRAVSRLLTEFHRIEYLVIGPVVNKPCVDKLKRLVSGHSPLERVRFLGPVPHQRLPRHYGQADLFVMLSTEPTSGDIESFGISCLEAMASGLPVVVSQESGMAEFIGKAGLAVPADDTERIAAELAALLKDKERRARMGKEARRIAERHTWERCASNTIRVYRKVLGGVRNNL